MSVRCEAESLVSVSNRSGTPGPDNNSRKIPRVSGEPGGNRTHNPQIKSLLLCQLSYRPEA